MLRNKYYQREKHWLAVERRLDELDPRAMIWVPLEKPVFAGWDIHVTLSESGKRRKDAQKLIDVLNVLGVGPEKPRFIRQMRYIRIIRRFQHKYNQIETQWTDVLWHPLKSLFNRQISKQEYHNLKDDLKPYFRSARTRLWNEEVTHYYLENFPVYELQIKAVKAYNAFIGHLQGHIVSEYNVLRRWLWHEAQAPIYASLHGHIHQRWDYNSGLKSRWKAACKQMRTVREIEDIEHIEESFHLYKKYR